MSSANAGAWSSLPIALTPWIMDVINSMGYAQMTPVQASTIPLFMKHKDVVVEAVTGSGKTLAFVIPVLERLIRREHRLKQNEVGALIISPTRELATQIHSVVSLFLSSQPQPEINDANGSMATYPPPLLLVSSESSPSEDVRKFLSTGADVVVGTPGRIDEFLLGKGRDSVSVRELEVLVLDEADRLLDLGFQTTLTRIIVHLPKQRRTGLFSATMTDADALSELVRAGLRNPARIVVKVQAKKVNVDRINGEKKPDRGEVVEERRIPANLLNMCMFCRSSEKLLQLSRIMHHEVVRQRSSRFIVYFSTCASVEYFYRVLPLFVPTNSTLYSLHGHLPPAARERTLNNFKSSPALPSSPSIMLATDVAARGLDIPDVDVVLQFDPPSDTKAFSHRCGRTARAGRSGRAWVLLVGRERDYVDFLAVRKIPLTPHSCFTQDGNVLLPDDALAEDDQVSFMQAKIRQLVLADRSLHDKAAKAFVSFVRAYSKHEASYIFRVRDLDLIGAAKCFGLLRLPRMPELDQVSRQGWQDADVDWDNYAYSDKLRDAKRLTDSVKKKVTMEDTAMRKFEREEKMKANMAWSNNAVRKEGKLRRKEKRGRKRDWQKGQKASPVDTGPQTLLGKRPQEDDHDGDIDGSGVEDDWDDLAREERMAKKLKKGLVSREMFDGEFGEL